MMNRDFWGKSGKICKKVINGIALIINIGFFIFFAYIEIFDILTVGISKSEWGYMLLINSWIIINLFALSNLPATNETWLALSLKRRRLEQQSKIKDLEERLKQQGGAK